jgi:transcriptional regulator with XRE-family HTH domain
MDRPVAESLMNRYGSGVITGIQIAAARGLLRITFEKLADMAGVSVSTVKRAEAAHDVPAINAKNLARIERALEEAGVVFISEGGGGGVGVRLTN